MVPISWVCFLALLLTIPSSKSSPFNTKKEAKKKCHIVSINRPSAKLKCYGRPDRPVCEERYRQVCENIVTKDSRVECSNEIVTDLDTEVCETELFEKCHTSHTTVYEQRCRTENKIQCHTVYTIGGVGVEVSPGSRPQVAAASSSSGSQGNQAAAEEGGGKKGGKGKKG